MVILHLVKQKGVTFQMMLILSLVKQKGVTFQKMVILSLVKQKGVTYQKMVILNPVKFPLPLLPSPFLKLHDKCKDIEPIGHQIEIKTSSY